MAFLTQFLSRSVLALLCVATLSAWTASTQQIDTTISEVDSCTASVNNEKGVYDKTDAPLSCQRWGLEWHAYWRAGTDLSNKVLSEVGYNFDHETEIGNQKPDWTGHAWHEILELADPDLDPDPEHENYGTTRLPTIKELIRIFDFNTTAGTPAVPASDHAFRAWLQIETNIEGFLDGYLISSTYRHINSLEMNGADKRLRYLGVEISTGKVVAFNEKLRLCESLTATASCIKPAVDVNVYAFLVSALP